MTRSRFDGGYLRPLLALCGAVILLALSSSPAAAQTWALAWADEFNAGGNADVNATYWTHEVGGNQPNAELEYYTAGNANCKQDAGGFLNLQARNEPAPAPATNAYTSCRIKTANKQIFGPPEPFAGKMEGRLQGPMPRWTLQNRPPVDSKTGHHGYRDRDSLVFTS